MEKILVIGCDSALNELLLSTAKKFSMDVKTVNVDSIIKATEIAVDKQVKALFVNVKFIDYSEIEGVKQLCETSKYYAIPIVFIIANLSKEIEIFMKIHSYNYLSKPYDQKELDKIFNNILNDPGINTSEEDDLKLFLKFKDWTTIIAQKDIIFVEYLNRKIVINTIKESIKYIHMPMKAFKEKLSDDFVQIHQSFIINKRFIQSIQRSNQSLKLRGIEHQLPIGRSYKQKVNSSIDGL